MGDGGTGAGGEKATSTAPAMRGVRGVLACARRIEGGICRGVRSTNDDERPA
jgi:hypothetical protein